MVWCVGPTTVEVRGVWWRGTPWGCGEEDCNDPSVSVEEEVIS